MLINYLLVLKKVFEITMLALGLWCLAGATLQFFIEWEKQKEKKMETENNFYITELNKMSRRKTRLAELATDYNKLENTNCEEQLKYKEAS